MLAHHFSIPTVSTTSTAVFTGSKEPAVEHTMRPKRRKARELKAREVSMVAAQLTATTKTAAGSALQNLGVAPTDDQIQEVLQGHQKVAARRLWRHTQNAEARIGHRLDRGMPTPSGRKAVSLPTGSLRNRLDDLRLREVNRVANQAFRHGASGGSSFRVKYATTSDDVDYKVSIGSNRNTYGGAYKGWSAKEDHHLVTVPKDWRPRVLQQGLAMAGGMMTLDAHALEAPEGISLYAAVWASQGRGYDVHVHRGFIAVQAEEAYHSDTAKGAIAGVRRKARAANSAPTQRPSHLSIGVDEFVGRYSKVECEVKLDDARDSGSCEFGIRSWCNAVGLEYDNGEAPLHMVLNAFRQRPQIEVRMAVLHAVRRYRAGLREAESSAPVEVPQQVREA